MAQINNVLNYCSGNGVFTNAGSTPGTYGLPTCWPGNATEDVWFSFTALGTDVLISASGIGGGGRYDGLMEILGGQPLSGIGFGLGVDRALLAAIAEGVLPSDSFTSDLFIIPLGEAAKSSALTIASELRNSGITTEIAFGDRALKGAMKAADKSGARFVVVLGEAELQAGSVELKRMDDGAVTSVKIEQLLRELGSLLSAQRN